MPHSIIIPCPDCGGAGKRPSEFALCPMCCGTGKVSITPYSPERDNTDYADKMTQQLNEKGGAK